MIGVFCFRSGVASTPQCHRTQRQRETLTTLKNEEQQYQLKVTSSVNVSEMSLTQWWNLCVQTYVKWSTGTLATFLKQLKTYPVLETKFEGRECDYLGQLTVTPKMVAMKIRDMKDNKSPGVDGIPPKLLLEIVEQISIPLATMFNLSLEEGIVPLEWKEANIIPLFKKVQETSQRTIDQ